MGFPVPTLHLLAAEALCDNATLILRHPQSLRLLSEESCSLVFALLYRKLRLTYELVEAFRECGHVGILRAIDELDVAAAAGIQTVPAAISRRRP